MMAMRGEDSMKNPIRTFDGVVRWDCIWFGNYPQSDAGGGRKEPIKWRVLQVDGNDAFLLADQCLDARPFHNKEGEDVTWETCSVRAWLNKEFLNNAFSAEEQNAIIATTVRTNSNYYSNDDDGIHTTDRVFLLSIEDVINPAYGFSINGIDSARATTHTAYSEAAPEKTIEYSMDWWWLRTSRFNNKELGASLVESNGHAGMNCYSAYVRGFKVRPALHLNLLSSVWSYAGTLCVDSNGWMNEKQTCFGNQKDLAARGRIGTVKKLADQRILVYVARYDDSPNVRKAAVEKLADQEILSHIAEDDDDSNVRKAAVKKLADQKTLIYVAKHDNSTSVRMAALEKLNDEETLLYVAMHDDNSLVKCCAVKRIADARTLIHIALNEFSPTVRRIAVGRLDDQETLIHIASEDSDENVRKAARKRLESLGRPGAAGVFHTTA